RFESHSAWLSGIRRSPAPVSSPQITVLSRRFRPIWAQEPVCARYAPANQMTGLTHRSTAREWPRGYEVDDPRPLQMRLQMKGLHERRPDSEVAGSVPSVPSLRVPANVGSALPV